MKDTYKVYQVLDPLNKYVYIMRDCPEEKGYFKALKKVKKYGFKL